MSEKQMGLVGQDDLDDPELADRIMEAFGLGGDEENCDDE